MRLALAMGRTLRELNASLGADELPLWRAFENLFDLPDGFNVASLLGPPLAGLAGAKVGPGHFAPYHQAPQPIHDPSRPHPSLRQFAALAAARARRRSQRDQGPDQGPRRP